MLTAAGSPGDRVTGLGLGADDYLPKPFHFPELVLRIRSLARRKPTAQPRILRAAGIRLDPLRRTVTRHGQQIEASPKEFAVLEALPQSRARRPQRRRPARPGMGRECRPVHQDRAGHHQPRDAWPRAQDSSHDRVASAGTQTLIEAECTLIPTCAGRRPSPRSPPPCPEHPGSDAGPRHARPAHQGQQDQPALGCDPTSQAAWRQVARWARR